MKQKHLLIVTIQQFINSNLFISFLIGVFICYYSFLVFQSDVSVGVDGYYYIIQVDSLNKSGNLYYPTDAPLILLFIKLLTFFTNDAVTASKLSALILEVLLFLGVASLINVLTGNKLLASIGVLLLGLSSLNLYLLSEFIKNLGAVVFLIWGAFGILKALKKRSWILFTILMFSAAIFSHRSGKWIICCFIPIVFFSICWIKGNSNIKLRLIFIFVALLIFIFPLFLFYQPFILLPDWMMFELQGQIHNPIYSFASIEKIMLVIISLTTFLMLFINYEIFEKNVLSIVLLSIVLWSLVFTLNPFLNHQTGLIGIASRLDILTCLKTAIAFPLMLHFLLPHIKKNLFYLCLSVLLFLQLVWFNSIPLGLQPFYLQTREELIHELPSMRTKICENPFIIAKHGDQFLTTFILKIPSQQNPPYVKQFNCVYWLIYQPVNNYQIFFADSVYSSNGKFTLVEESEMKKVLATISKDEYNQLLSVNPHLDPTAFLYKLTR